jgi:hypothetical protein
MPRLLITLFLGASVALAGCFQTAATLTVRSDGSGTIVERMAFDSESFAELGGGMATDDSFGDEEAQARAEALGEGVRLVGVSRIEDGGYTATYAFDDIRTLTYQPFSGAPAGDDVLSEVDGAIRFTFEPGATNTLRVLLPEPPAQEQAGPRAEKPGKEQRQQALQSLAMMRAMMGTASFSVDLVVDGQIVETDAAFHDGSTITLLDFSLGQVLDILQRHPELMGSPDPPTTQLQRYMSQDPDLRFQPPGTVTTRFR